MPVPCSRRQVLASLLFSPLLLTSGCGTILYPERRGQPAGRLDWGVVLLDGIGLILFFVPGVIAFAVDFATGAIYLPHDGYGAAGCDRSLPLCRIDVPRRQLTRAGIAHAVSQASGRTVSLTIETLETRELEHLTDFWEIRDALAAAVSAGA